MSKKCPFRLANPFDPTDGSWYWVTTDTYGGPGGAIGDGITDDRAAILAVMSAASSAGKSVYFPAGTYLVSNYMTIPDNLTLRGASEDTTTLTMAAQESANMIFYATSGTGVSMSHLGFYAATKEGYVRGLTLSGVSGWTLQNLKFVNMEFGIKLGNGDISTGLLLEDIDAIGCKQGLFLGDTIYSTFNRLCLEGGTAGSNKDHPIYVARGNSYLTFNGLTLKVIEGEGWAFHIYDSSGVSHHLTFNDVIADGGGDGGLVYITDEFSDVTVNGFVASNSAMELPWRMYGSTRVNFTGVDITGPGSGTLLYGTACADCSIAGTYNSWGALGSITGVDTSGMVHE